MKKGVCIFLLLLFAAVPGVFSQIASIHFAEAFPELCIWVNGLPIVMAEGAESVHVSKWGESPKDGWYESGYLELRYEDTYLMEKSEYNADGELEYSASFVYSDGFLTEMMEEQPLYDIRTVYSYSHYDDRTEMYMADADSTADPEWIKTLWYDSDGYLSRIEGPDWQRTFFYDDGYLVRAEDELWGQISVTSYTYTDTSLLKTISSEGGYEMALEYNPDNTLKNVYLDTFYQTTVYGDLGVELNGRGDISRIGPTEITWIYRK